MKPPVRDLQSITLKERKLIRHALGLPNWKGQSYRNRFVAHFDSDSYDDWVNLVSAGFARVWTDGTSATFSVTRECAEAVLEPGEKLDLVRASQFGCRCKSAKKAPEGETRAD